MRKPLYNIVIFIFHIITLILLFTLCIHFNVIKLDLLDFSKEAVASFFKNDYVVITKWKEVNPSEEIVFVYSLVRCRR